MCKGPAERLPCSVFSRFLQLESIAIRVSKDETLSCSTIIHTANETRSRDNHHFFEWLHLDSFVLQKLCISFSTQRVPPLFGCKSDYVLEDSTYNLDVEWNDTESTALGMVMRLSLIFQCGHPKVSITACPPFNQNADDRTHEQGDSREHRARAPLS